MSRFVIPNLLGKTRRPIIPHETPAGQTALFKPGAENIPGRMPGVIGGRTPGRVPTSTPPFKAKGYGSGDMRARVTGLARGEELSMKAKLAARQTRAKIARGEATRQTYKNKSEKAMLKGTENNGFVPMPTHGWPVHGPQTAVKADAEQAIRQTGRVLDADRAGQVTNKEFAFQMRNLMRRRKRS